MSTRLAEPKEPRARAYADPMSDTAMRSAPAVMSRIGVRDEDNARDHIIARTVITITSPIGYARLRPWLRALPAEPARTGVRTVCQPSRRMPPAASRPSLTTRSLATGPAGQ